MLHMRSSLNTPCLLPQITGILGASACGLCRTYCYSNWWLRFSYVVPALSWCTSRQHQRCTKHLWWSTLRQYHQCTLHLHLSLCTSRQHQQCTKHLLWCTSRWHQQCTQSCTPYVPRQHGVLEYLAPESVAYAVPIATATGGFGSLPIEFSVYTCTCRGVHRASQTVFTPRHTIIGVLGASASDLCRTFCNCNRWPQLSLVEPTVYSCTCGDIHCAGTSIARCTLPIVEYMRRHHQYPCTCACHGVHRAGISSVLRRASTGT